MNVIWDIVEGHKVRKTRAGVEIRRIVGVDNIPIDCSVAGTDPSVMLKAMTVLPVQFSLYPDPLWPIPLEEYELDSIRSVSGINVALIYRQQAGTGTGPVDPRIWNRTAATNSYTVETYSTAGGIKALETLYKSGAGDTVSVPAIDTYNRRIGSAREHRGYKTYRFTGIMKEWDWWVNWGQTLENFEFYINADQWGNKPRGTVLYMGSSVSTPISLTQSITAVSTIECLFMEDKRGHFPILAYFNERREHPKDAILESALRALGFPPQGDIYRANGKSIASVYKETDFTPKFPFTPQPEMPT